MATNTMDDPWDWTVGRVCQELTTTQRSWQPRIFNPPDLDVLRKSLQDHIMNGQALLTQVNNWRDVGRLFDVHVPNRQYWLLEAITEFRFRSPQYLSRYTAPFSGSRNALQCQHAIDSLQALSDNLDVSTKRAEQRRLQPWPSQLRQARLAEAKAPSSTSTSASSPALSVSASPSFANLTSSKGTPINATNSNDGDQLLSASPDSSDTELEAEQPVPQNIRDQNLNSSSDSSGHMVTDDEAEQLVPRDRSSSPMVSDNESEQLVPQDGSNSPMVTEHEAEQLPRDRSSSPMITDNEAEQLVPQDGSNSPMAIDDEAGQLVPQVESIGLAPASQQKVKPDAVKKPPKRLAFGMLTKVSEIDPDRNRDIPTYDDDILGLNIPDPNLVGRKIIAPQLIDKDEWLNPQAALADENASHQSDIEAAEQLHREASIQGHASDIPNVSAVNNRAGASRRRHRRARPAQYLAKNKLPVDDIFYEGVAFGADLPVSSIEPNDKYFSHTNPGKYPPGQIRYVNRMIRNFMLSKQVLDRTRRATGLHFSSDLLAVDIQRDAHGELIPEPFVDPAIFDVEGEPCVSEANEQPLEKIAVRAEYSLKGEDLVLDEPVSLQETAVHAEYSLKGEDLVLDELVQPEPGMKVALEASESHDVELEDHGQDDEPYTFFTAIRTYYEGNGTYGLMTWRTTPSFTLYYKTPNGEVRARREKVADWAELMGDKDPRKFSALSALELIGLREEREPEYYLHWQNKLGDGTVVGPNTVSGNYTVLLDGTRLEKTIPKKFLKSDEEYDTATWNEILRERGETQRRLARQRSRLLTMMEINAIFDQATRSAINTWTVLKLPKHTRDSYRIWMKSRKRRTKRVQIKAAEKNIQRLEDRLARMRNEVTAIPWSSAAQALRGCRNIEPTVFDIQFLKWMCNLLANPICPAKPDTPQSNSGQKSKAVATSADKAKDDADDYMGDFLVSDDDSEFEWAGEEEQVVENMEDSDDELDKGDRPSKDRTSSSHNLGNSVNTPVRKSGIAKRTSEVIDLTESPPAAPTSANDPNVIDLTTPSKKAPTSRPRLKQTSQGVSPLAIGDGSKSGPPSYNNPLAIDEFSYEHWEKELDRDRLMIKIFYNLKKPRSLLRLFERYSKDELWQRTQPIIVALQHGADHLNGMKTSTFDHFTEVIQLSLIYIECKHYPWGRELCYEELDVVTTSRGSWWGQFHKCCSRIDGYLNPPTPGPQSPLPLGKIDTIKKREYVEIDDDDEEPTKRRRIRAADNDDDFPDFIPSPSSTRKRPVVEDANAREARTKNKQRLAEQEQRRATLKAKLAKSGNTLGQGTTKHMINDSAALDQGHVFVNEEIGRRIKQHQVEGVRFMWNQVVAVTNESSMQGCLLAHTMGLGKTMQVITLLVAIVEAASSSDPSISSQIPSSLKGRLRILILCPPGLIDNWMDEFLAWTPGVVLGDFWKLSSLSVVADRLQSISDWHKAGGVLICGYEMFRNLVQNKATAVRLAPLTMGEHEKVLEQLTSGPDIVIADEAHKLKNAKSGLASAASQFRTKCRIALTGSPLANNVEEYHSMIDFVQPGYLGPAREFRSKFKEPIERRNSRRMLTVLNEELALKVQRADLTVLKNDLPPKKEFVMSVPLTELQRKVYSLYVQSLSVRDDEMTKDGEVKQATIWSWLAMLSLLCNHPHCFNSKIHEENEAPSKQSTSINEALSKQDSPDNATDDDHAAQMIDVPVAKAGLSAAFVEEVTRLFEAEDLNEVNLSNKVKVLCQILDAAKEAGDKTLVFSSSIPTLNFLETLFKGQGRSMARLDGTTAMVKRQRLVKNFNTGSDDIFLISTTAGGLGLNLQSANRVVIFDFKYNPIQEEQAVGRAYRIGQLKPTFVYRFVCGGTFEDNIHNKTLFKSQLASRVVDKKRVQSMAKKSFGDFLFQPKVLTQQDLSGFRGMDPAVLDKILASQDQTATIFSIVQTDSFQVDEEYDHTPEELAEIKRQRGEMDLQRHAEKTKTHLPTSSLAKPSPPLAPQYPVQDLDSTLNRSIPSAMSQPQLTGPGSVNNGKQTPILPPAPRYAPGTGGPRTPQGGPASFFGSGSGSTSSAQIKNRPIMGAGTSFESAASIPYGDAANFQEPRRASDIGARLGAQDAIDQSVPTSSSNGQRPRIRPQKTTDLWPVLRDVYQSNVPNDLPMSQIPIDVHQRSRDIARDIPNMVNTRIPEDSARMKLCMQKAFDVLRSDTHKGRQLIESKLSIADFVDDLIKQFPPSNTQQTSMFHAMKSQFSSSPYRGPNTPVNGKQNRTASHNVREDDAEAMAEIDRKRKAKGDLPLIKPHKKSHVSDGSPR
ncbi:hypothetical protein VTL71DRAFT_8473 [Oculimacula yallundae]|uniref:Uncharacterized protein n=1 Tax=Oculimacula yallundae TaxID=86028 RepID=A0ABR4CXQ8_9HELO